MAIIYIGDRSVGKTQLAMELANPRNEYVRVLSPSYEDLRNILFDENANSTRPTDAAREVDFRFLEIQAKLPSGSKNITIDWIDTPGEIWRKRWQADNPEKWKNFLNTICLSEGILLVLNAYRDNLPLSVAADYSTQQQWCERFQRWVDFFRYDCPKAKHIVICLNKADLFCDLSRESSKLAFTPNGSQLTWQERHSYVLKKYFRPIQPQIEQISQTTTGLSVRCFITSIHDRPLLELPWIYLASFLAK